MREMRKVSAEEDERRGRKKFFPSFPREKKRNKLL